MRIPLNEFGRTTWRIVCQRVASTVPARLPELLGDGRKGLLGAGDDHREGHDRQGEGGCEDGPSDAREEHERTEP